MSKVRHVQETERREVDLGLSYLEDGSKPGLNRTLRLLSCKGQHILYSGVYVYIFIFNTLTPGIVPRAHRTDGSSGSRRVWYFLLTDPTEVSGMAFFLPEPTKVSGTGMILFQKSQNKPQKFRVRV